MWRVCSVSCCGWACRLLCKRVRWLSERYPTSLYACVAVDTRTYVSTQLPCAAVGRVKVLLFGPRCGVDLLSCVRCVRCACCCIAYPGRVPFPPDWMSPRLRFPFPFPFCWRLNTEKERLLICLLIYGLVSNGNSWSRAMEDSEQIFVQTANDACFDKQRLCSDVCLTYCLFSCCLCRSLRVINLRYCRLASVLVYPINILFFCSPAIDVWYDILLNKMVASMQHVTIMLFTRN